MHRFHWISFAIVSLWAMLLVADAGAQQRAGQVHRMVEGKRGKEVLTSQRATLWQQRTPRYPVRGETVFYRERLRMLTGLRLDLRIDRPDLESRHVFSTDTGTLAAPALTLRNITFDQEGVYEIREDPRRLKGVELILTKGMMWLELARGGVAVRAAGTVTYVDGTEVLFVVDKDSTSGILYLDHGAVSFPDYPDIRVLDGQAWRLQNGLRPTLLDFFPGEAREWKKMTKYNDRSVWKKVWWKRPAFYIPAAAAGVALIAYAIFRPDGPSNEIDIEIDF